MSPDGIMLSNGPGDPVDNSLCIDQIKKLIGKKPIFGVGMGHELFALSVGAQTEKMKHGHRGGNPVKNVTTGRVFISSQNHGYAVKCDSLPESAVLTHINVNDGTCEGIDYPEWNAFTIQFDPVLCTNTKDANILLQRFVDMMKGGDR